MTIDPQGSQFVGLSGLGITENDYAITGNRLTLWHTYLRHFMTPGSYGLTATFDDHGETVSLPADFEVTSAAYPYQIINGGFETGDMTGWMGSPLWKSESGLFSWRSERVVSSPYYGSSGTNIYNRDGNYHLGVYADPYDNANKDLNQERMGILRSSPFVLGGSGWISFKLGGGENVASAYVSIKNADTGLEVARYGNRHFGDTALSGTANADAYLFPYVADLSAHLGETLYIALVDAASHEWSVLSADSFDTYYPLTPAHSADTLAVDIKPVIARASSATNTFVGNLTSGISEWENPLGILQWDGDRARTNKISGNNDVGAIRSPAFRIDPSANHVLVWDWEGNIALDKQIFALIKEVGTNNEVLRLTRRDNLSTKNSGGFDKHWYDLSSLDPAKAYYVEFVDNAKTDWGLISIKNIELVAGDNARVSVTTDQAVNAYDGPAMVSPADGAHRQKINPLDYFPMGTAFEAVASLGADPTHDFAIRYRAYAASTFVRVYHDEEVLTDIAPQCTIASAGFRICRADIQNLMPGTAYSYRIFDGSSGGPLNHIKTIADDGAVSFAFMADAQSATYPDAQVSERLLEAVLAYDPNLATIIQAGDVVETGQDETMWDWFFEDNTALQNMPIWSIPGNHDYYDQDHVLTTDAAYSAHFAFPENGPGNGNASYFVTLKNTTIFMLDTVITDDWPILITWFQQTVAQYPSTFKIVVTHYSSYGPNHEDAAALMKDTWNPIFEASGIDLVLSGHDHVYARTPAMNGGVPVAADAFGTTYVIGGSASAKIYTIDAEFQAQYAYFMSASKNVISDVTISDHQLTLTVIDESQQLVDTLVIPARSQ